MYYPKPYLPSFCRGSKWIPPSKQRLELGSGISTWHPSFQELHSFNTSNYSFNKNDSMIFNDQIKSDQIRNPPHLYPHGSLNFFKLHQKKTVGPISSYMLGPRFKALTTFGPQCTHGSGQWDRIEPSYFVRDCCANFMNLEAKTGFVEKFRSTKFCYKESGPNFIIPTWESINNQGVSFYQAFYTTTSHNATPRDWYWIRHRWRPERICPESKHRAMT